MHGEGRGNIGIIVGGGMERGGIDFGVVMVPFFKLRPLSNDGAVLFP